MGTGGALVQYQNEHSAIDAIKKYNGEYLIIGFLTMKIFIQILIRQENMLKPLELKSKYFVPIGL